MSQAKVRSPGALEILERPRSGFVELRLGRASPVTAPKEVLTRAARDRCSWTRAEPRTLNSTRLSRPLLSPALMRDSGRGVLKEEAQHFSAGIRPARVGVGAGRTAAGPGVPGSVQNPLF
jgi:hypothetical protein